MKDLVSKDVLFQAKLSYVMYGFDKDILCICFEKISGIIHLTSLLVIPFTEYPSLPSLCMYVGNKKEVGLAEVYVFCMCVMSAVMTLTN